MRPAFPSGLVRPDLRSFPGYPSARTSDPAPGASIWLNANESATPNQVDPFGRQRRYPDPQPPELVAALAGQYGVDPQETLVGRGSDEAIDLLVRTCCRPGQDGVATCSPTFGMYAVSARLHGVPVLDVPQEDLGDTWRVDVARLAALAAERGVRIVFVASPGNPTGSVVPRADLAVLADRLSDTALVVVDEAYQEFSGQPSALHLLREHSNLVVLRTLSKAHGLAAARVGVAAAHADLVRVLRRVQAPYPVPTAVADLAVAALAGAAVADTTARVGRVLAERDRLARVLQASPLVLRTYRSEANFVLARCTNADALLGRLRATGIEVRDMRHLPLLADAVRVTVGTPAEVDAVSAALASSTTPLRTA